MVTIIVADDEKLIRAGIKKILQDNLGEVVNIIEAKNGSEAYSLCLSEQPDVIITDIRMPGMDGVELMNRMSLLPEKPAIIVLSGFDDFTYAKAAITNGALAYLLKPVDTKELITAMNKALLAARKQDKIKNEKTIRAIMSEGIVDSKADFDIKNFPSGMYCVAFCGRHCNDVVLLVLGNVSYYVLEQKKDFICLIVSKETLASIQENEKLSGYILGISRSTDSVLDLRKLYRETYSALFQSYFQVSTEYITTPRKPGSYTFGVENVVQDFADLDSRYEKIIAAMDLLSQTEAKKAIDNLFDFSTIEEHKRPECLRYIYNKIVNNLFKRFPKFSDSDTYLYLKGLMIENIHQVESIAEWIHYVTDYIFYLIELLKGQQGKYPYITKAIAYINKHYSEPITMASVANYVSMNYTWFSEKFKEQIGVNFNDYLKRYRMEQAKHFLEMGTYKVYEVAIKSGFKDVKHFMKSFREMNGMSAGEWARIHSQNDMSE